MNSKAFSFPIPKPNRDFYLISSTENDRKKWIEAIRELLDSHELALADSDSGDLFSTSLSSSEGILKEKQQIDLGSFHKLKGKKKDLENMASGTWQRRWLILKKDRIMYYRKPTDTKEAGSIFLSDIRSVLPDADTITQKSYSFQISTVERYYHFYASSEAHRTESTEQIQNALPSLFVRPPVSTKVEVEVSLRQETLDESRASLGDDFFFDSYFEVESSALEGFLWKTPGTKKKPGNWQKRWFVLKGSTVLYYRNVKVNHTLVSTSLNRLH